MTAARTIVGYVWHYLKHVQVRDVCCQTLEELRDELRLAVASLRHKGDVLRSFPRHVGYHL